MITPRDARNCANKAQDLVKPRILRKIKKKILKKAKGGFGVAIIDSVTIVGLWKTFFSGIEQNQIMEIYADRLRSEGWNVENNGVVLQIQW